MRLQKYLSQAGVASRRKSEELIESGRVSVNGQIVTIMGAQVDLDADTVRVDGKVISLELKVLYRMNKPDGVITTMKDTHGRKCVGDLVGHIPARVFPVGRLDKDVVGLLLFTNDGLLADALLHPRNQISRIYWARVKGKLSTRTKLQLLEGVDMKDGRGSAARVRVLDQRDKVVALIGAPDLDETLIEVVVHEGRKHFVKNLLATVRLPVQKLARVAFGPYSLGDLRSGEIVEQEPIIFKGHDVT